MSTNQNKLEQRKLALQEKHQQLDDLINKEETRPYKDAKKLLELKQEKLRLRDEISKLD